MIRLADSRRARRQKKQKAATAMMNTPAPAAKRPSLAVPSFVLADEVAAAGGPGGEFAPEAKMTVFVAFIEAGAGETELVLVIGMDGAGEFAGGTGAAGKLGLSRAGGCGTAGAAGEVLGVVRLVPVFVPIMIIGGTAGGGAGGNTLAGGPAVGAGAGGAGVFGKCGIVIEFAELIVHPTYRPNSLRRIMTKGTRAFSI